MMRVIDPDKINYVLTPSECSLIRRIYRVKAQDVKEVIQWMEEATEGAAAYFAGIDPDTLTAVRICHWISVRLMAGIKAFHANDGSAEWWVDGEMPHPTRTPRSRSRNKGPSANIGSRTHGTPGSRTHGGSL